MTDIVEQLRDLQSGAQWACGETAATLGDAADEIEQLRVQLERTRTVAAAAVKAARREGIEQIVKMFDRHYTYDDIAAETRVLLTEGGR